jgi:hypothetical protein
MIEVGSERQEDGASTIGFLPGPVAQWLSKVNQPWQWEFIADVRTVVRRATSEAALDRDEVLASLGALLAYAGLKGALNRWRAACSLQIVAQLASIPALQAFAGESANELRRRPSGLGRVEAASALAPEPLSHGLVLPPWPGPRPSLVRDDLPNGDSSGSGELPSWLTLDLSKCSVHLVTSPLGCGLSLGAAYRPAPPPPEPRAVRNRSR